MTQIRRGMLAIGLLAGAAVGLASAPALAGDSFQEIERRFQEQQRRGDDAFRNFHEEYRTKRAAMEGRWKQREHEVQARWDQAKQAIEQKWDQALRSTPREWVDYSPDQEARSIVDFENGTIEVTALVPRSEVGFEPVPRSLFALGHPASDWDAQATLLRVGLPSAPDARELWHLAQLAAVPASWTKLLHQFEQIFSQEAKPGRTALADQVVTREGKPVDKHTAKAYVQEEILPGAVVEETPVASRDGVTRVKVTARVRMTPDHVKRRALQYQDLVPVYAKQHGIDPRLLYAIIHTESFFNPRAQSPYPTYGLMQLVPRGAARDAYNFLYKDDRVLDDDYLMDPAHNVELGATYLRLLGKQLLTGMEEGEKRTTLLICAYKWGPGNTQQKILKQVRVQDLTDTQVVSLLNQRTPEDTRHYLKQVRDRMGLYEEILQTQTPAPAP